MIKFKIGDTVRVLNNEISSQFLPVGSVTTITEIDDEDNSYGLEDLQNAKASPWWAMDEDIELHVPNDGGSNE